MQPTHKLCHFFFPFYLLLCSGTNIRFHHRVWWAVKHGGLDGLMPHKGREYGGGGSMEPKTVIIPPPPQSPPSVNTQGYTTRFPWKRRKNYEKTGKTFIFQRVTDSCKLCNCSVGGGWFPIPPTSVFFNSLKLEQLNFFIFQIHSFEQILQHFFNSQGIRGNTEINIYQKQIFFQ